MKIFYIVVGILIIVGSYLPNVSETQNSNVSNSKVNYSKLKDIVIECTAYHELAYTYTRGPSNILEANMKNSMLAFTSLKELLHITTEYNQQITNYIRKIDYIIKTKDTNALRPIATSCTSPSYATIITAIIKVTGHSNEVIIN